MSNSAHQPRSHRRLERTFLLTLLLALTLVMPLAMTKGSVMNINERALVHALGIDQTPQGYTVTLQIFQSSGSGSDTPVDPGQPNVQIVKGQGPTVEMALADSRETAGKELFLGHLQVICLGSTTDLSDPQDLFEFTDLNKDIPTSARLCLSQTTAEDIISVKTQQSETSSEALENILEIGERYSWAPSCDLNSILTPRTTTQVPVLPLLGKEGKDQEERVVLRGAAVTQNGTLFPLTENEIIGMMLLSGRAQHIPLTLEVQGRELTCELELSSIRRKLERTDNGFLFAPTLTLIAHTSSDIHDPDQSVLLSEAAEARLSRCVTAAETKALSLHTWDLFRLGETFRQKLPGPWALYPDRTLLELTHVGPEFIIRVD